MSSTLSPALKNILEAVEDNYVRCNLTRYACGEYSLWSCSDFRVSADRSSAIGMTILCYDTLLTFADEVRDHSSVKAVSPLVARGVNSGINPRLVDRYN